jgi:DNA polymerase-3 subunit epsilon
MSGANALPGLTDALPESHAWTDRFTPECADPLPTGPAVLLFVDESGQPVQLLTTQQLKRLVISRLEAPDAPRRGRADLAAVVRGLRWRNVHCPFEARWCYYRLARTLYPQAYRRMVAFGPAWFLLLDQARTLPEIRLTERIWCGAGEFVGPWPTQKGCREALEGLWDLFDLCRYPEQLRRAPHGTRCAYAEMGRCDAPCDGSAPAEAYASRCAAAWRFACGESAAWVADAQQRMKAAAAAQRFEQAGKIKKHIAFAQKWVEQWTPLVRPANALVDLLAIPVTRRKAWKLFLFRVGELREGPVVRARELEKRASAWALQAVQQASEALPDETRMEQTWLYAHFLAHRERESALIVEVGDGVDGDAIARALQGQLEALTWRRSKKGPTAET